MKYALPLLFALSPVATLANEQACQPIDEAEVAATYLGGSIRQRRTGVGWRSLGTLPAPASAPTLTLPDGASVPAG